MIHYKQPVGAQRTDGGPHCARAGRFFAVLAVASVLGGCGMGVSRQDVIARMERNFAAANYRAAVLDLKNLVRDEPDNVALRLKLAEGLLRTRDFQGAAAQFDKARETGAAKSAFFPGLIEALSGEGEYQAALDMLADAGADAAPDAKLLRLRGQALLALNRYSEAREAFAQALGSEPRETATRIGLASALEQLGDTAGAKSQLDQANEAAPEEFAVHVALGRWDAQAGQVKAARDEFAKALTLADQPKNHESPAVTLALAFLAEAECALGDLASAGQHLKRLEKLAPAQEPTLLLKARIAIQASRMDEAQIALQQLLSRNPNSRPGKLLMGVATAAGGKLEQAAMYLSAALSEAPEDLAARKLLAEVQLRQKRPRDALKTATIPSADADADLLSLAGRASVLEGDLPGAVAYFERGQQSAPHDKARSLEVAAAYLATNRNADALRLLESLDVPENLADQRELLLLAAMVRSGQQEDVHREARSFAAARPRDLQALVIAARGLLAVHEVAAARAQLEQATVLDARAPQAWLALGLLEWSQGDHAAADRAFTHTLQLDARNLGALLGKAQVAVAEGNFNAAIQQLEQARSVSSNALSPRIGLGRLYLARGERDRAAAPLAEAQKLAPEDPNVRLLAGILALARGQSADAIPTLESLARQFPSSSSVQTQLARAYILGGRVPEAHAAVAAALKTDPGYWPALGLQTTMALDQGDPKTAGESIARMRDSRAPKVLVLTLEGDVAARKGQYADALRAYMDAYAGEPGGQLAIKMHAAKRAAKVANPEAPLRTWLQRAPGDVDVRLALAQALQVSGDRTSAAREYETVLRTAPKQVVALNNLAWLKLQAGETGPGLELARRAFETYGNVPSVADTYGWALVQSGNVEEAATVLRAASAAAPKDTEVRYHFAVALLKAGMNQEAAQNLQAVVDANERVPETNEARTLLASLRGQHGQ